MRGSWILLLASVWLGIAACATGTRTFSGSGGDGGEGGYTSVTVGPGLPTSASSSGSSGSGGAGGAGSSTGSASGSQSSAQSSTTSGAGGASMVICGDGEVDIDEQCDDGNVASGDGCDSACFVEKGWSCMGSPSACAQLCGDGLVVGSESCDDGNGMSGDGCVACLIEPGWTCAGSPSVCSTVCGDGLTVGAEQCDDGNTVSGDGCSSGCTFEGGVGMKYGNTVPFGESSSHSPDYLLGMKIAVPQALTLTHIGLYGKAAGANVIMALYTDVGGNPSQLVAQTPSTPVPVGSLEIPVPSTPIQAGSYWIMAVFNVPASVGYFSGGGDLVAYISHPFGNPLPAVFPAPLTYNGQTFNYWIVAQ